MSGEFGRSKPLLSSSNCGSDPLLSQFCDLAVILGKFENQIQAIKEALTLRQDFHPEILFNHLSAGEYQITKSHLAHMIESNQRPQVSEEAFKLLFSIYGFKDRLNYSDFLNYIYPHDTETIKTISTVLSKKYSKLENQRLEEEVLALFIILMEKEVEFMHHFEETKNELLSTGSVLTNREPLKRLIKSLKKQVPVKVGKSIENDYVVTFQEMKNILRNERNINEAKAQPICRRLSLQKHTFIGIDQLEVWLRAWPKIKACNEDAVSEKHTLEEQINGCYREIEREEETALEFVN